MKQQTINMLRVATKHNYLYSQRRHYQTLTKRTTAICCVIGVLRPLVTVQVQGKALN